jgi:hypothetical protein
MRGSRHRTGARLVPGYQDPGAMRHRKRRRAPGGWVGSGRLASGPAHCVPVPLATHDLYRRQSGGSSLGRGSSRRRIDRRCHVHRQPIQARQRDRPLPSVEPAGRPAARGRGPPNQGSPRPGRDASAWVRPVRPHDERPARRPRAGLATRCPRRRSVGVATADPQALAGHLRDRYCWPSEPAPSPVTRDNETQGNACGHVRFRGIRTDHSVLDIASTKGQHA